MVEIKLTGKEVTFESAMGFFASLAKTQGLYGRLVREINKDPEPFKQYLEEKNFKSHLDLLLAIES